MISDALSEASDRIKYYLKDKSFNKGELPDRLNALVKEMDDIRVSLDTPPKSEQRKFAVSPSLPLSSPAGGMLPEGVGLTDTQHGQMIRLAKHFTGLHGEQFIIDCFNGEEGKYIKQHQEKQVVEPLAKWLRSLVSK
jgi:hypothetical protein